MIVGGTVDCGIVAEGAVVEVGETVDDGTGLLLGVTVGVTEQVGPKVGGGVLVWAKTGSCL